MSRVAELILKEKALSFLRNEELQLIFFGGKGGVGKTTSSAATAVYLARENPQRRILVVSTDPAHSLGDSFDCPIGSEIAPIKGMDNLWGWEVDAPTLMEDFREQHYRAMRKIAQRGTIMLERDINRIMELTLPGLDEMIAMILVADLLKAGVYDLVILDTAPTGHTLRLLEMPAKMIRWAEVLDLMQEKHRFMSRVFGDGKYRKDDADAFSKMIARDIARVNELLTKERITEFIPVMIPEPMSIYETERLLATLKELKIPVRNMIINRMAMKEECPFCLSRQRDQADHLAQIEQRFGRYHLIKIPLFPHEIRGIGALADYAEVLSGNSYQYRPTRPAQSVAESSPAATAKLLDLLEGDFQFLIFGGKGGVGKTSSAAATALTLARHNPEKKILIFSTDPAHSLADSFDQPIGDEVTQIEELDNLYAIEVDAPKLWQDFAQAYKADIHDAFYSTMVNKSKPDSGTDVLYDRDVMAELIDASPLGIDEVMALEKIVDLVNEKAYDLIILDTAPTGHLVRFLELPERVRDWLKNLFQLFIRYKQIMPLSYFENINRRLIRLSKGVRGITATLINPQTSEFVAVTIPEAMATEEMEDLLYTLKKLEIPCRHIIINMIIPLIECGFCACKREEQQRYVQQVKDAKSSEYLITEVELFPHQIRGLDGLSKYAERIF